MFGLSWGQITIIVLVGVFVLGPERIPTAVTWVIDRVAQAADDGRRRAGASCNREIGPETRRAAPAGRRPAVAQGAAGATRPAGPAPQAADRQNILGDEFSGGDHRFPGPQRHRWDVNRPHRTARRSVRRPSTVKPRHGGHHRARPRAEVPPTPPPTPPCARRGQCLRPWRSAHPAGEAARRQGGRNAAPRADRGRARDRARTARDVPRPRLGRLRPRRHLTGAVRSSDCRR